MGGRSRDDSADAPARSVFSGSPLLEADISENVRYLITVSSTIDEGDRSCGVENPRQ